MSERPSQPSSTEADHDVHLPYNFVHSETPKLLQDLFRDPQIYAHLRFLLHHHRDSFEHCVRVGGLSIDLALDEGCSPEDVRLVGVGGLLHDLGKCDIAEELLSSTSRLSREERETMKTHSRAGFERLAGDPVFDRIRRIVVAHHEMKKDPYPRSGTDRREPARTALGRRAEDELLKRFTGYVAVADMLDALARARSYKQELPREEVERILREQFTGDARLIGAVMKRVSEEVAG